MTAVVDTDTLVGTNPAAVSGRAPATIRVFRIDDWLSPDEVPGELARTVGAGRAREVVAMGRWSAARREWAAQLRVRG